MIEVVRFRPYPEGEDVLRIKTGLGVRFVPARKANETLRKLAEREPVYLIPEEEVVLTSTSGQQR